MWRFFCSFCKGSFVFFVKFLTSCEASVFLLRFLHYSSEASYFLSLGSDVTAVRYRCCRLLEDLISSLPSI